MVTTESAPGPAVSFYRKLIDHFCKLMGQCLPDWFGPGDGCEKGVRKVMSPCEILFVCRKAVDACGSAHAHGSQTVCARLCLLLASMTVHSADTLVEKFLLMAFQFALGGQVSLSSAVQTLPLLDGYCNWRALQLADSWLLYPKMLVSLPSIVGSSQVVTSGWI